MTGAASARSGGCCVFPSVGVALLALFVTAAAAQAQETITVAPSGAVAFDQMLRLETLAPRTSEIAAPRVPPFMPAPPARDLGPPPIGPSRPRELAAPVGPPAEPEPSGPSYNAGFVALPDNNALAPPDTMGAVGPGHLMTMLNTEVRIQDKTGSNLSTVSLSTFWTSGTGLSGSPFDPRVVYDSGSGRWIATVDADANSATSQVWFAISATNDPTGSWTFYGFTADSGGTTWADFPGFGVNATWIAITNNMWTVAVSPGFVGAKMWVIDKSTALTGGTLTLTIFATSFDAGPFSTYGFALQPAVTFGSQPKLYVVDSTGFLSGATALLRMSEISGTGSSPSWTQTAGSPFAGTGLFLVTNNFCHAQIGAEQLGVASTCDGGTFNGSACYNTAPDCDPASGGKCRRLHTGDGRISANTVFRNGKIWVAHSGGRPATTCPPPAPGSVDRTSVLWYQLDPALMVSSGAPIVQSGVIELFAGIHHYYPSIAVNANDDVCVGFSRSDSSAYVQATATGRFGTDPLGYMDAVSVLKLGEDSYYKTFSDNRNRWGDYSATVIDPSDDLTCWTLQEYAAMGVGSGATDDRWGTWWAQLTVPTTTSTTATTTTTTTTLPPLSKCTADKFKATGKKANTKTRCHARAVAKGIMPVDSTCLAKSEVKFSTAFAKTEAKGANCLTSGDAATIEGDVDSFISALAGALGGPGPNACASTKYKNAGKKAQGKVACHAKALSKGLSTDSTCLAKTEVKFSTAFAKADAKGGCITSGDASAVEAQVDSLVDDVENGLVP